MASLAHMFILDDYSVRVERENSLSKEFNVWEGEFTHYLACFILPTPTYIQIFIALSFKFTCCYKIFILSLLGFVAVWTE